MDLGAPELQVFVSVVVILGAAFVALVCDYLKGHNEQLRERNIELRARLEERERIVQAETTAPDPSSWLNALADRSKGGGGSIHSSEAPFGSARPALAAPSVRRAQFDHVPEVISSSGESSNRTGWAEIGEIRPESSPSVCPPAEPPIGEIQHRVDRMAPSKESHPEPPHPRISRSSTAGSFSGRFGRLLGRKFIESQPGEDPQAESEPAAPPLAPHQAQPDPDITRLGEALTTAVRVLEAPVAANVGEAHEVEEMPERGAAPASPEPLPVSDSRVSVAALEGTAVEDGSTIVENNVETGELEAPVDAAPEATFPWGLFGADVWNGILADARPFSGVVFCVGICDYNRILETQGQPVLDQVTKSLLKLLEAAVAEQGFAAHASQDTFVLVFKDERGALAQRRINGISERLWDNQLRNLGPTSVLFSWGAVEVERETVQTAYSAAVERMNQSRRNRRGASIDSSRKVVTP